MFQLCCYLLSFNILKIKCNFSFKIIYMYQHIVVYLDI